MKIRLLAKNMFYPLSFNLTFLFYIEIFEYFIKPIPFDLLLRDVIVNVYFFADLRLTLCVSSMNK